MSDDGGYTTLQSLLVFQAVAAQNRNSAIFEQVSQALKQNTLFLAGGRVDDNRYSSHAIEQLYLRLAKQEARGQLNGATSPRKRTIPASISQKSVDDRHESRVAAAFVPSVYGEYRRSIIAEVREEERDYKNLRKELASLRAATSLKDGNAQAEVLTERAVEDRIHTSINDATSATSVKDNEPGQHTAAEIDRHETNVQSNPRRSHTSIDSIINHDEPPGDAHQRPRVPAASANTTPLSGTFPSKDGHIPHLNHGHTSFEHRSSNSPHLPISGHDMRHAPSPGVRQGPYAASQSPQTPVILPPPQGMPLPPPSSWNTPHSGTSATTPRPPSVPISPRSAHPLPHPHDPYGTRDRPQSDNYYRDDWRGQPNHPAATRTQPPPPQYPPYQAQQHPLPAFPNAYSQQRGGVMLPPYQLNPQAPNQHGLQLPRPAALQTSPPMSTQKNIPPHLKTRAEERPAVSTPVPRATGTNHVTPYTVPAMAHLHKSGTHVSPGSSTAWKVLPNMPTTVQPRPSNRSISPISDEQDFLDTTTAQQGRSQRGRFNKAANNNQVKSKSDRSRKEASAQGTDTSSVRSQSITSQVGDERAARFRSPFKKLKNEPPGTPAVPSVSGDDETAPSTVRPARKSTKAAKRRRESSINETNGLADSLSVQEAFVSQQDPPDTVAASKNFGRMAKSILDIIASDKHASMFANPVNERQAEGYKDIIKRPTDLKTIRNAIIAGAKAVAAATADMATQASPTNVAGSAGAAGGTVVLPITEALVPPKGIVNAAQLEQEIMRMFANAVMFNPGDDEIVQDTREMYKAVQGQLQQWRAGTEVGDEAGEDDSMLGSSTKRKRLQ